ncbi:MAG: dTDP-4-dehydrorhamnose 3,5-epimerase [Boseongicola sp.]|nr:dTDP-4-dehydrorhamnose 3,5-epimerase [Boseongicola sp.]NNJ69531.1 dTDP-4-dehydrorhamnose 3,5-epimerase [Boseongicola sp.]
MIVEETSIPDLLVIVPARHGDSRGFFSESWNSRTMAEAGIDIPFVQDNHSMSETAGTLRGLHFQSPPHAQAKLVRCGRGSLLDAVVDVRRGSPSFGKSHTEVLSYENGRQLLVPEGFLHGFLTLEPMTEIVYKCSDFYNFEADGAVHWESCGIDWGLKSAPLQSPKDAKAQPLSEFDSPFEWVAK